MALTKSTRTTLLAALGCGLVAALPFAGLLRPGRYFALTDVLVYLMPIRAVAAEALAHGRLALWDPYVECGQSLAGNPIGGLFYPPFLLSLLPGLWWGAKLYVVGHYLLLGAAAFVFFRAGLRLRRFASAVGALTLAGSGYLQSMVFTFHFTSAPWLLLGATAWIRAVDEGPSARRWRLAALAGLGFGVAFLGGELEQVFVAAVCLPVVTLVLQLGRTAGSGRPSTPAPAASQAGPVGGGGDRWRRLVDVWRGRVWPVAWPCATVGTVIVLVPAVQILISATRSVRSAGLPREELLAWSCHPLRLVELILPYAWGIPDVGQPYAGRALVGLDSSFRVAWAPSIYVGGLCLLLLPLPVRRRHRDLAALLWLGLFAALALAFGRYTPLYDWFLDAVPVYRVFRYPEKWLLWVTFALAALAALKAEAACRPAASAWVQLRGANCLWPAALLAAAAVLERLQWREWNPFLQHHLLLVAGRALVLWLAFNVLLAWLAAGDGRRRRTAAALVLLLLAADVVHVGLWRTGQFGGPDPLRREGNPAAAAVLDACRGSPAASLYRVDTTAMKGHKVTPREPSLRAYVCAPARQLECAAPACFGLRSTAGIYPNTSRRLRAFRDRFRSDTGIALFWALTGSRFLVVPDATADGKPVELGGFRRLYHDSDYGFSVYDNPGALPRLTLFHDWRLAAGPEAALDALSQARSLTEVQRTLVVEAAGQPLVPPPADSPEPGNGARDALTIREDAPGCVRLRVSTGRPALLFVGECYDRGWTARVDGRGAAVLPAAAAFMAVPVPAGTHDVDLRYRLWR